MLTKADDFPIHQRPDPIAKPGTDKNFYDRYFFNGYAREGRQFFALALGVYPNRNVIDASFCVIHDGVQHNLRASRHLGGERMDIHVGPISIEVLEPLRSLRIRVDDGENGIKADLTFTARAVGAGGAPLHARARTRPADGLHPPHPERLLSRNHRGQGRAHHGHTRGPGWGPGTDPGACGRSERPTTPRNRLCCSSSTGCGRR